MADPETLKSLGLPPLPAGRLNVLRALKARIEAASGPDRDLDVSIMDAVHIWPWGGPYNGWRTAAQAFDWDVRVTRSVEAALALIKRTLPNHHVELGIYRESGDAPPAGNCARVSTYAVGDGPGWEEPSRSPSPALALLSALLATLIAEAEAA